MDIYEIFMYQRDLRMSQAQLSILIHSYMFKYKNISFIIENVIVQYSCNYQVYFRKAACTCTPAV